MFGSLSRPGEPRPAAASDSPVKQPRRDHLIGRHARPCAGHPRLCLGQALKTWMAGHRQAEATPFFERLSPGHDERRVYIPRDALRPSCPSILRPKRAWGMPGARAHPQPRVEKVKPHELVTAGTRRFHPAFPHANGFNGFLRALLGDRAFLPPSQATMRKHRRQLDASVGASGPHDFAVRGRLRKAGRRAWYQSRRSFSEGGSAPPLVSRHPASTASRAQRP